MISITQLLDETGKLPAYAWPGGYPIVYLDAENSWLCPIVPTRTWTTNTIGPSMATSIGKVHP